MFNRKKARSSCEEQRQVVEAMSEANLARFRPSIVENLPAWAVHKLFSYGVKKIHGRSAQSICESQTRKQPE